MIYRCALNLSVFYISELIAPLHRNRVRAEGFPSEDTRTDRTELFASCVVFGAVRDEIVIRTKRTI